MPSATKLTEKQERVLVFVRANPGCATGDVGGGVMGTRFNAPIYYDQANSTLSRLEKRGLVKSVLETGVGTGRRLKRWTAT